MFTNKSIGIAKIIVWYIVAILLLCCYFFIDQTGFKEFIDTADQHRPDLALGFLILYAIAKYLTGLAGLIMISFMSIMLIRLSWQKNRENVN